MSEKPNNEECQHRHKNHQHGCDCSRQGEDKKISVHIHETAVVGSIKYKLEKSYDESKQMLDVCMRKIADAVSENGGIIGHIKAYMVAEGDSYMISITDEESRKRHIKGQYVNIEGVAIVFGIEPAKLYNILEEALYNLKYTS